MDNIFRDSERARKEEYRRTLNEINERIEKRPLLFERTVQVSKEVTLSELCETERHLNTVLDVS